MRVFIKYTKYKKKKIYTSSELDNQFDFIKYNNLSYVYSRNNGPNCSEYKNNELTYEAYYKNGKNHRLNGPSVINYETNCVEYWIDSEEYENEFEYWLAVGNHKILLE